MWILLLILYIAGFAGTYRFFNYCIVEIEDRIHILVLIIMSIGWPIVYIVFTIKAIKDYWRKINGKMRRL